MRLNSRPSRPVGLSPDSLEPVSVNPPVVWHGNSWDAEGDGLVYSYEVYEDSQMTVLVAQGAGHPEGTGGTTAWAVPVSLPDGGDYYWRVRAFDGYEYGDWSALASFVIPPAYVCGDANGDTEVNVGDAVFIITYVFKGGSAPDPIAAGDANGDGECNVADAVFLINFIFKGGPAPICL